MNQKEQILAILWKFKNEGLPIGEDGDDLVSELMWKLHKAVLREAISRIQQEVPDSEWISSQDKIPQNYSVCILRTQDGSYVTGIYNNGCFRDQEGEEIPGVTHYKFFTFFE